MIFRFKVQSVDETIKEQLAKEEEYAKKSNAILEEINEDVEEQQVMFSKEMTAEYNNIDKQWEENVKVQYCRLNIVIFF